MKKASKQKSEQVFSLSSILTSFFRESRAVSASVNLCLRLKTSLPFSSSLCSSSDRRVCSSATSLPFCSFSPSRTFSWSQEKHIIKEKPETELVCWQRCDGGTTDLSALLLQFSSSFESWPFNFSQAAPQLRHLLLSRREVLLQHRQPLLLLLTLSLHTEEPNTLWTLHICHFSQRCICHSLKLLPDSLCFCTSQSFSQLTVRLADGVSLLADVAEAASQLRHLSSVVFCLFLSLVETSLNVQHVPSQLVSALLVSRERSSALVQLEGDSHVRWTIS